MNRAVPFLSGLWDRKTCLFVACDGTRLQMLYEVNNNSLITNEWILGQWSWLNFFWCWKNETTESERGSDELCSSVISFGMKLPGADWFVYHCYLIGNQGMINSFFLHKMFMSSLFNNSSVLNTNNNISCSHGGKPVCDHYRCSTFSGLKNNGFKMLKMNSKVSILNTTNK